MFTATFTVALVLAQAPVEAEPALGGSPPVDVVGVALQEAGPATSAFRRGLLPFADYVAHVESVASGLGNDASAAFRATIYADAERRLAAFRQPAAEGWAADLAEARFQLARSRGATSSQLNSLARRAVALREADLRFGIASPVALAETIVRVMPEEGDPATAEQRAAMERTVRRCHAEQLRLGVGRSDQLALSRIRSGEVQGLAAVVLADRAFEEAVRYQRLGTASLFDVTRAFVVAREVLNALPEGERFAAVDRLGTLRRRLESAAGSVRDPRGRNEADVRLALRLLDESRTVRAARPVEYDDTAVEPGAPAEVPVDPTSINPGPETTKLP